MSNNHRSFEIVANLDVEQFQQLDAFSSLWNKEQRRLYKHEQANPVYDKNAYKRDFIAKTTLTGRHFNSIRDDLKAKKDSVFEQMRSRIDFIKTQIIKLNKAIKTLGHKSNRLSVKEQARLFNSRRKLTKSERILLELEQSLKQKDAHLCFGSKHLFKGQFNVQSLNKNNPNQFKDFDDWKQAWSDARSATFCMVGSKDETCGNSNCQLKLESSNSNAGILQINTGTTKLKVPVVLKYGKEFIQQALLNKQALTYRFNRDLKTNRWRVRVSLDVAQTSKPIKTLKHIGVVAVDINSAHLAVVDIDRFGNVVQRLTIDLNLYGKSTDQAKAITGDAVKQLIIYADSVSKPLVIEDLDFQKKRLSLKEQESVKYKRMLSSFSYNRIIQLIKARAADKGIELRQVNPAFTSQIGALKYKNRLALTGHHAAALVIGRRGMEFNEKLFKFVQAQATYAVPVRNQYKSRFAYWKTVFSKIRAHVVQSSKTGTLKIDDSTFGKSSHSDLSECDHGDFCFATNLASVAVSLA